MDSKSADAILQNILGQYEESTTKLGQELLERLDLPCQSLLSGSDFVQQVTKRVSRELTPVEKRQLFDLYAKACSGKLIGSTPPDFGWNLNQTLNQLVGFAETKLSALIAADIAIFILLLPNKPSFPQIRPSPFEFIETLFVTWAVPVSYFLALLFFLVSIGVAVYGFPASKKTKQESRENEVSWRCIEEQDIGKYQDAINDLNASSVEEAYARENYYLSRDLGHKYQLIHWSTIAFIIGLGFALMSSGLSFILR